MFLWTVQKDRISPSGLHVHQSPWRNLCKRDPNKGSLFKNNCRHLIWVVHIFITHPPSWKYAKKIVIWKVGGLGHQLTTHNPNNQQEKHHVSPKQSTNRNGLRTQPRLKAKHSKGPLSVSTRYPVIHGSAAWIVPWFLMEFEFRSWRNGTWMFRGS